MIFKKNLIAFAAVLALSQAFGSLNCFAQNWAQHIAPIFYSKCTSCHHSGGIAPFPLITYLDAQPWASFIKTDVQSGKMPPWPPDTTYLHYVHERVLSQQQINSIVTWVNNGAPQGNPSLAPPPPVYNSGSFLGTPDLKLTIPVYTSVAATQDKYQCFAMPTNFPQDRYIKAIEVVPGNSAIVHHVVVMIDSVNIVTVPSIDTTCAWSTVACTYAPGSTPTIFPNGANVKMGMRLPAGASIHLQIHYPQGTAGMIDSTSVHLFFYPVSTTGVREIYSDYLLGFGALTFPPDSIKTYVDTYGPTTSDLSFLSVFPHMHLIGKEMESYSTDALNDTSRFVKINNWDFHWQDFYNFKKVMKITMGSTLHLRGLYDNTANNPNNPNSPPQLVVGGRKTTDEMFICGFLYLAYQPGDENISLDTLLNPPTATHEILLSNFACYAFPNPTSQQITFQYYLDHPASMKLYIYDSFGRTIKSISEEQFGGTKQLIWNGKEEQGNALSNGIYFYRIEAGEKIASGEIVLSR